VKRVVGIAHPTTLAITNGTLRYTPSVAGALAKVVEAVFHRASFNAEEQTAKSFRRSADSYKIRVMEVLGNYLDNFQGQCRAVCFIIPSHPKTPSHVFLLDSGLHLHSKNQLVCESYEETYRRHRII
jgi:hypothetical protein